MDVTRNKIVTLYFNRGAYVMWQCHPTTESGAIYQRHGIIECELTHRPGWYYVRNEHGNLDLVQWSELSLAVRK